MAGALQPPGGHQGEHADRRMEFSTDQKLLFSPLRGPVPNAHALPISDDDTGTEGGHNPGDEDTGSNSFFSRPHATVVLHRSLSCTFFRAQSSPHSSSLCNGPLYRHPETREARMALCE